MTESNPIRILLVEDNPGDARLIAEMLRDVPGALFDVRHVELFADALDRLAREKFDVALLDLSLPDSQWLGAFAQVKAHAPQLPVIVLTGLDDPRVSAGAAQAGAADYLLKGNVTGESLVQSIRKALRH